MIKLKIKTGLIYLILIIVLQIVLMFSLNKPTITGFAVLDENATTNDTNDNTTTTETTAITINETQEPKEKPEKESKQEEKEKPEKSEPNKPPVWKSDANEFIAAGKTIIDLSNYFFDENNDTISYAATTPEKISVTIENNLVTLIPDGSNFTATIEFTADDGDKSTSKEVALIVPEKIITINLQYKLGTNYDADDNGYEATSGVIDLTVENSLFSWSVNESNLCARWDVYSVEDEKSTTVCYGSDKCCGFIGLSPSKELWNEVFYSTYGRYGATLNNIASAQVIYVDYGKIGEKPYAEIYYSSWQNLSANYYFATIDFENVCVETCALSNFNETSYKLIFEIDNAILDLKTLTYSIVEEISKVLLNLEVINDEGLVSGSYQLYKDNAAVPITEGFVEPDYYDIEVVPTENVIDKLVIENANITKPLTASIGIDNVSRKILIENVDVKKRYAVNLEELEFENAKLTATANANSLYKCRQWDYESEVCFGEWVKIKDLIPGQQYELTLTAEDPGFIEGNLNITILPLLEFGLIKEIPNITININENTTLNLSNYFSNIDENTIFNYFKQDGISILFDNNIATIIPDKDFVGTVFTYITANKSDSLAVSNVFSVNVVNATIDLTPSIILKKKDFSFDEDVEIDFEYLTKQELIKQNEWKEEYEVYEEITDKTEEELKVLRQKIKNEKAKFGIQAAEIKKQKKKFVKQNESLEAFVLDSEGNSKDINIEIEELREGKFELKLPKQRQFRAGKYTIKLELVKDGAAYSQEQDFTWGVLAINVNKSIYLPNEHSFIGIAVLDDKGKIVCDADVTLEITNPLNEKTTLTTANNYIKISPECNTLGVTILSDYYTSYKVNGIGTYLMNLTAVTYNGIRSIEDNFTVASSVDFDVARHSATRIYPPAPYAMNISIIANKNYNGIINEYVPSSFDISEVEFYEVVEQPSEIILSGVEVDNKALIQSSITKLNEKEENGFHSQAIAPRQYLVSTKTESIKQYLFKYLSVEKALTRLGSHSQAIAPDRGSGFPQRSAGSNFIRNGMELPPPASKGIKLESLINEASITKLNEKENKGFRGYLALSSQNEAQWIEHLSDSREYDSYITHNYINVSDETDAYVVERARSLMDKAPFWLRGRCWFDNGSEISPRSHLYVNVDNEKNERKQTRSLDKTPVWLRGISHEFLLGSEIAESHTIELKEYINYKNVSILNKENSNNEINLKNNILNFFTLIPSAQAQSSPIVITTINDTKIISINANLKKGSKYVISYKFDAPDISPEFYLLGELDIGNWKEARQWQIASDQALPAAFCDSGDLTTTCTISSTKRINNSFDVLSANNVLITGSGRLVNATAIKLFINLTGNLTIESGGGIFLNSTGCVPAAGASCFSGGNITIEADVVNLTSDAVIITSGGRNTGTTAQGFGGKGGIVNISAKTFYFNGNITVDGGDHSGTTNSGSGGDAGDVILSITNSFDINGNIFARGGTSDSNGCDNVDNGLRGDGGSVNITNKNANVISGSIGTSPGEAGACRSGVYKKSEIYAQKINGTNVKVAGIINASNITITGVYGVDGNGNGEATGVRNNGQNLTIKADILNLTSTGVISGTGLDLGVAENEFGGAGANININATTMYFDGNITLDGGDHSGTIDNGAGGHGGTLILDITNSFDINGNIFARGGTGDSAVCAASSGIRGDGGSVNITNKNALAIGGNIDTSSGEVGACPNGEYKNSEIYAQKINGTNIKVAGTINASNITITGIYGANNNGNNNPTARNLGANLTIVADILNLTTTGLISGKGLGMDGSLLQFAGAGASITITATTMYFNGNISLDGGDHSGAANNGNGGNGGTLILNVTNSFDINGNIFARGGTGDSGTCTATNGNRGDGGTITIVGSQNITYSGNITAIRGEVGACTNGDGKSITINASNVLNVSSTVRMNVTGDVSGDITLKGNYVEVQAQLDASNVNGTILIEFNSSLAIGSLTPTPSPQVARFNEFGRVRFKNNIGSFATIDFNNNISIAKNLVFVDSDTTSDLNQSAEINLNNLNGLGVLNVTRISKDSVRDGCVGVDNNDFRCALQTNSTRDLSLVSFNVTRFTNYSINLSGVRLDSPANGTTDTDGSVTFQCSANDNINLTNITLYHNISGAVVDGSRWSANFTFNATDNKPVLYNTSSWAISSIADGNYIWNCRGYDNSSNNAFGDDNFSLTVSPAPAGDTTKPIINGTLNKSLSNILQNDVINASFNMTDESNADDFNCTITINSTGAVRYFNFSFASYVAGNTQQCSQNFTISESAGTVINITGIAIDNSSNRKQNETVFTIADVTFPIVNTTFNITSPVINDVINFSGNITDETGLSTANITYNMSGILTKINFTLSSTTAQVSNATKLTSGGVINFTMYATDTSNNVKQNSTLITVADATAPIINGSLNKSISNILQNDVINASFNATDETGLHTGQVIINDTGANRYFNFTLSGATAQFSQNFTVSCAAGCVVNVTGRVNDTSNNLRQNETIFTVAYAKLNATVNAPPTDHTIEVLKGSTFDFNVTITCSGNLGSCGNVNVVARYNASGDVGPATNISTLLNETPFFILRSRRDQDIVVALFPVLNELRLYEYVNGAWRETNISNVPDQIEAIDIDDADNDGMNEIVAGLYSNSKIHLMVYDYNVSSGTWIQTNITNTTLHIEDLEIGDADNDGKNEIVIGLERITTTEPKDVARLRMYKFNDGVWNETNITGNDVTNSVQDVDIGDVDNDGLNEIVVLYSNVSSDENEASQVSMFKNSSLTWVRTDITELQRGLDIMGERLEIGDPDNDGRNEIVIAFHNNAGSNTVGRLVIIDNETGVWVQFNITNQTSYLVDGIDIGDANHDGRIDIAVITDDDSGGPSRARLYENTSGWKETNLTSSITGVGRDIDIGDATNDGLIDIIAAMNLNLSLFENISNIQKNTTINTFSVSIDSAQIGDPDNDERLNNLSCGIMNAGDNCQLNYTIKATGSVGTFWLIDVNATSTLLPSNDSTNVTIHIVSKLAPIINGSLNKSISNILQNDVINASFNATDETALHTGQMIINDTGANRYFNFTLSGATAQFSQNFTVSCAGCVVNVTGRVNDTSGNLKQNETIFTVSVADTTAPIVNATLNKSLQQIELNDIINITANATDETGLSTGQIIVNDTGFVRYFNFSLSGTSAEFSQNITISCSKCIINFTARANDTSNNFRTNDTIVIVTPEVEIANCANLTTANTNYSLISDANSGATCFYISANNIGLDCHGYEINYSQSVEGYGVNISSYNYSTIKSCNIVQADLAADNSFAYGVYIFKNASNNTVFNNTITTYGSDGYGVVLSSTAYNNSVYGNTITTNGSTGYGVYLTSTAYNNNIYNNDITTSGSNGYGVYLTTTNYNNSIYGNAITTSGANGYGVILLTTAYNNNVYSNNITTSNITSYGIYLADNVYNNTIYDNNITTKNITSSYGIYLLQNVNNNTFYRNKISSLAIGILVNGTGQTISQTTRFNTFINDTIVPCNAGCANNYYDVVLTANATDITFVNVSFNKSRVAFIPRDPSFPTEKNNLTVKWFLNVNVTNSTNNNPIANAEVVINDSFAVNLFTGTTDATGGIATQIVTEYTQNGSVPWATNDSCRELLSTLTTENLTCFTPYNITVNLSGYNNKLTSLIVNRSKFVNISLGIITAADNAKPRINASLNATSININQVVNMTANVTDDLQLSFCQFIDNQSLANGAKTYFNKTVVGTNDQCSQNYTIRLSSGNVINFTVLVNDTSGNINQSEQIISVSNCNSCAACDAEADIANKYVTIGSNLYIEGATCISVGANNVTIDCNGLFINGSLTIDTWGIEIQNVVNTVVNKCNASMFMQGVRIFNSNFSYINNTITRNNTQYGISLTSAYHNIIRNVTVFGSGDEGIHISNSVNNTISYSKIEKSALEPIYLLDSINNTIIHNTINNNSGPFYFTSSNYTTVVNNTITATSVQLSNGASYNIFINNTVIGRRFYINQNSSNNTIINLVSINSTTVGIRITNASGNVIIDSNISGAADGPILAERGGNNTFLNTSFKKSTVSVTDDSIIYVQWYLDVHVSDKLGNNLPNANVSVFDNSSTPLFNGTTDSSGNIQRINITEYWQTSTTTNFFNNHTINVSKESYAPTSFRVNISTNTFVNITLGIVPPVVNAFLNKSANGIYQNDVINLSANTTDDVGLSFGQVIVNDTGITRYFNFTLSGTADTFSQNITISCGIGCVINFTAAVNDTNNTFAYNETIFTIAFGNLLANITAPANNTQVIQNTTFALNATVKCSFAECGEVIAHARYNSSGDVPNSLISRFVATPLYLAEDSVVNDTIDLSATDTNNWLSTSGVNALAHDNDQKLVYLAGASAKFGYYNITSNVTFDLRATDVGNWVGTTTLRALAYDSDQKRIYLAGSGGKFGFYNTTSNITHDLTATDAGDSIATSQLNALTFDSDQKRVYLAGSIVFGFYNTTSNITHSLNDTDVGNWLNKIVNGLTFDSDQKRVYLVANGGEFGFYNTTSNITHDLSETDVGDWVISNALRAVTFDTDQKLVFIAGDLGMFGFYNTTSNITHDLTDTDPSNWIAQNTIRSLAYDSAQKLVYLVGDGGIFGYYNRTLNTTLPLNYTDANDWIGATDILTTAYDSSEHVVYLGGASGLWAQYELFGAKNPKSCGSMSKDQICYLNWTVNATGVIGSELIVDVNFSSQNTSISTNNTQDHIVRIISGADETSPVINGTLNKSISNIFQNDIINASFNATDETGLSTGQVIINDTGFKRYFNFTLSGTRAEFSQNFTVACASGCVVNVTGLVNDTSNNLKQNETIFTVASAANAVPIIKLNNATGFAVDPVSGGISAILISFNVTDADGVATINASKAIVNLTLGGFDGQFRFNVSDAGGEFGTCRNHTESSTMIINCTILLRYYDNASANWVINVSVQDTAGAVGRNDTLRFTYNFLSGISLPNTFINFSSVFLGQQNVLAYPHLLINNTGNDDFDMVNMTAAALTGTTTTSENIAVTNFFVNLTNSSNGDLALQFPSDGNVNLRDTATGGNVSFLHGHTSAFAPNADKGNISAFIWVDVPSSGLSPQLYNATWNLTAVNNP